MKKAHVICCNDGVVAVSIGSEVKAKRLMKFYMLKDFLREKYCYTNLADYKRIYFWHIHPVTLH